MPRFTERWCIDMCGIVGLVDLAGLDRTAVEPRLNRAVHRLGPRGPDGHGIWADTRCALGHTRLAVIDLSPAAAQPMQGHGYSITYNGEIYNYRALRKELASLGYQFATHSDTEVLLAGWRQWGAALLDRLSGMFAFALWDAAGAELILVRDRFGKKPLLYRQHGRWLVFSSDLIALERAADSVSAVDSTAMRLLFTLRYVPEPWCIAEGVAKLPAGHMARFSASGLAIERWYHRGRVRGPSYTTEEIAAADLRTRLDAAVADRTVADVPVGAFLSGGIDSAIITASLVAQTDKVRTFTVGFPGAEGYYEERPAARQVASYLGTDHTEIELGPHEARAGLEAVFEGFDEPFADSSAVPTYLLSHVTRRHVTVALSGDGADEVFGGYRKYAGELYAEPYRHLPTWVRRQLIERVIEMLPEGKDNVLREYARRARRFAAHAGRPAIERQAGWTRLLSEVELDQLFAIPAPAPRLEDMIAEMRRGAATDDPINAMLAAEIDLGLVGDMLVKVDRMSMANSLEVRCPWLDHRVVACAEAMPGSYKLARTLAGPRRKRILRRAFADRLPAAVFRRPKKGFEAPVARWLTNELRDLTRRAIDPGRLARQGLFRPELPQRWYDELEAGRRDTSWPLWTLVAFQSWSEGHGRMEAAA